MESQEELESHEEPANSAELHPEMEESDPVGTHSQENTGLSISSDSFEDVAEFNARCTFSFSEGTAVSESAQQSPLEDVKSWALDLSIRRGGEAAVAAETSRLQKHISRVVRRRLHLLSEVLHWFKQTLLDRQMYTSFHSTSLQNKARKAEVDRFMDTFRHQCTNLSHAVCNMAEVGLELLRRYREVDAAPESKKAPPSELPIDVDVAVKDVSELHEKTDSWKESMATIEQLMTQCKGMGGTSSDKHKMEQVLENGVCLLSQLSGLYDNLADKLNDLRDFQGICNAKNEEYLQKLMGVQLQIQSENRELMMTREALAALNLKLAKCEEEHAQLERSVLSLEAEVSSTKMEMESETVAEQKKELEHYKSIVSNLCSEASQLTSFIKYLKGQRLEQQILYRPDVPPETVITRTDKQPPSFRPSETKTESARAAEQKKAEATGGRKDKAPPDVAKSKSSVAAKGSTASQKAVRPGATGKTEPGGDEGETAPGVVETEKAGLGRGHTVLQAEARASEPGVRTERMEPQTGNRSEETVRDSDRVIPLTTSTSSGASQPPPTTKRLALDSSTSGTQMSLSVTKPTPYWMDRSTPARGKPTSGKVKGRQRMGLARDPSLGMDMAISGTATQKPAAARTGGTRAPPAVAVSQPGMPSAFPWMDASKSSLRKTGSLAINLRTKQQADLTLGKDTTLRGRATPLMEAPKTAATPRSSHLSSPRRNVASKMSGFVLSGKVSALQDHSSKEEQTSVPDMAKKKRASSKIKDRIVQREKAAGNLVQLFISQESMLSSQLSLPDKDKNVNRGPALESADSQTNAASEPDTGSPEEPEDDGARTPPPEAEEDQLWNAPPKQQQPLQPEIQSAASSPPSPASGGLQQNLFAPISIQIEENAGEEPTVVTPEPEVVEGADDGSPSVSPAPSAESLTVVDIVKKESFYGVLSQSDSDTLLDEREGSWADEEELQEEAETCARRFMALREATSAAMAKQGLRDHAKAIKSLVSCDMTESQSIKDVAHVMNTQLNQTLWDFEFIVSNAVRELLDEGGPERKGREQTSRPWKPNLPGVQPSALDMWSQSSSKMKLKERDYCNSLSSFASLWNMYNAVRAELSQTLRSPSACAITTIEEDEEGEEAEKQEDKAAAEEEPTIFDAMPQVISYQQNQDEPSKSSLPYGWKDELNLAKEALDDGVIRYEDYLEHVYICLRMAALLQLKIDTLGKSYAEIRIKNALSARIHNILSQVKTDKGKLRRLQEKAGVKEYVEKMAGLDRMERALIIEHEQTQISTAMAQAHWNVRNKMRTHMICVMTTIEEASEPSASSSTSTEDRLEEEEEEEEEDMDTDAKQKEEKPTEMVTKPAEEESIAKDRGTAEDVTEGSKVSEQIHPKTDLTLPVIGDTEESSESETEKVPDDFISTVAQSSTDLIQKSAAAYKKGKSVFIDKSEPPQVCGAVPLTKERMQITSQESVFEASSSDSLSTGLPLITGSTSSPRQTAVWKRSSASLEPHVPLRLHVIQPESNKGIALIPPGLSETKAKRSVTDRGKPLDKKRVRPLPAEVSSRAQRHASVYQDVQPGTRKASLLPFMSGAGTGTLEVFDVSSRQTTTTIRGIDSVVANFPSIDKLSVCLETKHLKTKREKRIRQYQRHQRYSPGSMPPLLVNSVLPAIATQQRQSMARHAVCSLSETRINDDGITTTIPFINTLSPRSTSAAFSGSDLARSVGSESRLSGLESSVADSQPEIPALFWKKMSICSPPSSSLASQQTTSSGLLPNYQSEYMPPTYITPKPYLSAQDAASDWTLPSKTLQKDGRLDHRSASSVSIEHIEEFPQKSPPSVADHLVPEPSKVLNVSPASAVREVSDERLKTIPHAAKNLSRQEVLRNMTEELNAMDRSVMLPITPPPSLAVANVKKWVSHTIASPPPKTCNLPSKKNRAKERKRQTRFVHRTLKKWEGQLAAKGGGELSQADQRWLEGKEKIPSVEWTTGVEAMRPPLLLESQLRYLDISRTHRKAAKFVSSSSYSSSSSCPPPPYPPPPPPPQSSPCSRPRPPYPLLLLSSTSSLSSSSSIVSSSSSPSPPYPLSSLSSSSSIFSLSSSPSPPPYSPPPSSPRPLILLLHLLLVLLALSSSLSSLLLILLLLHLLLVLLLLLLIPLLLVLLALLLHLLLVLLVFLLLLILLFLFFGGDFVLHFSPFKGSL